VIDRAEVPALDLILDKLHVLSAAPVEDNAKNAVGTPRRLNDHLPFSGGRRQRFLDHDVFAGFQRGQCYRHVQYVRHGDSHRLDIGVCDQILVVSINARNVKLLCQFPASFLVESRNGDDLGAWILGEPL
jgi:hypothetical protein